MDGQRKGEEVKEWIDRQTDRERHRSPEEEV